MNPVYGGVYSESTAVRYVLESLGVRAAHNGQPISEAMVFGISGGIGFAYFKFEYQGQIATTYIGVAHRYKTKFGEFMVPFFERTGLKQTVKTSTTVNAAEKYLLQALQEGKPVIVHTDLGLLPYDLSGRCYLDHALVVTSFNEQENTYVVADRAGVPLPISREDLQKARASITAIKNRSCIIEAQAEPIDLGQAVQAGIRACCDGLRNPTTLKSNFGLGGMKKWMTLINDPKNKSGWPTLFPAGVPLLQGLHSLFLWIEILQAGRGALRGLYADFLKEASGLFDSPQLADISRRYDRLSALWTDLAEAALPDQVPLLGAVKQLERQKDDLLRTRGMDALEDLSRLEAELKSLRSRATEAFPLNETESRQLLDGLRERVEEIVRLEEEAIIALEQWVSGTY